MRILFINPDTSGILSGDPEKLPPLGILYLASSLEREGHRVRVFDNLLYKRDIEAIRKEIASFNPEMLGISITSASFNEAKRIAAMAKMEFDVPIVIGGAHPTIYPIQSLESTRADIAVIGEGEGTVVELAKALESGRVIPDNIKGIAYKEKGIIKQTEPRSLIEDLDSIPRPAWHLINLKDYPRKVTPPRRLKAYPVDSHNTSRGCPFRCRFCSLPPIWHKSFRSFSPERMVSDVRFLVENYKTKGIYFREDNFTVSKGRVHSFCELLKKEKIDVKWMCESRVELVNKDLLSAMKSAGCEYIWFGVESGVPRMLEYLGKGITIEDSITAFKLCKEVGMKAGASFMIGMPGETLEEIEQTIKFQFYLFKEYGADFWTNTFTGIPSSPIYEEIVEKGLYSRIEESGICEVETPLFNKQSLQTLRKEYLFKCFKSHPFSLIKYLWRKRFPLQRLHWLCPSCYMEEKEK
jgi:radical SAM superfamily enzyme YgiQ (UPF0313 family)